MVAGSAWFSTLLICGWVVVGYPHSWSQTQNCPHHRKQGEDSDLTPGFQLVSEQWWPAWKDCAVLQREWKDPAAAAVQWKAVVAKASQDVGTRGSGDFVGKTLRRLPQDFYWGQQRQDVVDFCWCCDNCTACKGPLDRSWAQPSFTKGKS